MAIDTENKRKSVLNFSIPGAYLLPVPDGVISDVNRRQMTDSYALVPRVVVRSGWVKDTVVRETWVPDSDLSDTWVPDTVAAEAWLKDQEIIEV